MRIVNIVLNFILLVVFSPTEISYATTTLRCENKVIKIESIERDSDWVDLQKDAELDLIEICGRANVKELPYLVVLAKEKERNGLLFRHVYYLQKYTEKRYIGTAFYMSSGERITLNSEKGQSTTLDYFEYYILPFVECIKKVECAKSLSNDLSLWYKIFNPQISEFFKNISTLKNSGLNLKLAYFKVDYEGFVFIRFFQKNERWLLKLEKNVEVNRLKVIQIEKM